MGSQFTAITQFMQASPSLELIFYVLYKCLVKDKRKIYGCLTLMIKNTTYVFASNGIHAAYLNLHLQ